MKEGYNRFPWERAVALQVPKATAATTTLAEKLSVPMAAVINKPTGAENARCCATSVAAVRVCGAFVCAGYGGHVRQYFGCCDHARQTAPRRRPRCATTSHRRHTRAGHARWPHPVGPASLWLDPLSVRSSFCVVALTSAAAEAPSSCPRAPARLPIPTTQRTLTFVRRPDFVRPASAPICRLFTDRCGECARATVPLCTVSRRALGSHRRSIACAALRSLAGASARRAQDIRR